MKQYHDLLADIVIHNGTTKGDRTGTGTKAVFGRQMRFDLQKGFPLVTTKKVNFNAIKAELIWFLEGSTNAQRLNELGAKIWDQWAMEDGELGPIYGKQWRSWACPDVQAINENVAVAASTLDDAINGTVSKQELIDARDQLDAAAIHSANKTKDQISEAIDLLKNNPDSRRIIVTAWNPSDMADDSMTPEENAAEGNMALAACHALFQFYTERLTLQERIDIALESDDVNVPEDILNLGHQAGHETLDASDIPARRLSCQLYQR